jgi:hypothetical protein
MTYNPIIFSTNLIKGRIAETIFEQMLRDAGGFTILAFGYESVLPEIAHRQHDLQMEETMEIIRRAPDFAVINNKNHEVHLIEVKYMMHITQDWVFKAATRMYESWKPSYLFIATPERFYYGKAEEIVKNRGVIKPLGLSLIPKKIQENYISILNKFINSNL